MDKLPWLAAETGTLSGTTVSMSGTAIPFSPYPSRTFAAAAADSNTTFDSTDLVSLLLSKDADNWNVYRHATWTTGSPSTISLVGAELVATAGTLADGDVVKAIAITPDLVNTQQAVPADETTTGFIGDWAYDNTTGYYYKWISTGTVVRFATERVFLNE